ncbi:LLM class flavin-dependent oxidoreductase [Mangrovimicrobium sediminis]|uniref:LLM class flavin-dependent oxidoreductase n=1 Tax=Mangrovimicrobium sediminis TaxID=2562682 RepID=A0A4Z0LVQ9_9GAMM|nr:LLM class flavin-dependent oxidoreductase [Haliea sp. SAOS-164]TGD71359.1 LLM class flavin-dependent oxidoreductase [Haliea sp. SAOS-164]
MNRPFLEHGLFIAPYHDIDESPTVALRRDIELVAWCEQLGFREAWFGEHHSTGWETICSPELMIAAAAERTRSIRLGTGVVSLPFHNPLMVANRIIQLDHMTMGRTMFGAGPGLLTTDAQMLGIDIKAQRDMMARALDVILRLLRGEEVTDKSSWYTLERARVHLLPYSHPHPEVAVASAITPSGGMTAGKYGLGMLCVAATETAGFDVLGENWKIANQVAAEHGQTMDPRKLRLVAPMHIAETREQARADVREGLARWCEYFDRVAPKGMGGLVGNGDPVDLLVNAGRAVIGTPADAIAMVEKLIAKQGEFGVLLLQAHNWAEWGATKKSYELYARHVMPHFERVNRLRRQSFDRLREDFEEMAEERQKGADLAFARWREKTGQE